MKLVLEDDSEITLAQIKKETEESFQTYYLSKSNKEDVLEKATKTLEKSEKSVYLRRIKYSIDENDFLYLLRVI